MSLIVERTCGDATDLSTLSPKGRGKQPEQIIKTKATLVICPVALIGQWQREILNKTEPKLNVCVHHGQGRTTDERTLAPFDGTFYTASQAISPNISIVIITSYSMVANDLVEDEARCGPLSRLEFHRFVLQMILQVTLLILGLELY